MEARDEKIESYHCTRGIGSDRLSMFSVNLYAADKPKTQAAWIAAAALDSPDTVDQLYAAAKKEGKVSFTRCPAA